MNLSNNFNLNIKKKIAIRVLTSFVLFCLIIYFFSIPLMKKIKTQKQDIIDKKIELEDKMSKDKNIISLNKQMKEIEPKLIGLDQIFININRELDFITLLESVAVNNGIEQRLNMSVDHAKENNNIYQTQDLIIDANGKFKNIIQYISDLEALNYYITINSININGINKFNNNSETQDNFVKLTINALTYWK